MDKRQESWDIASRGLFDVAIVGGGINGACLFHQLAGKGYTVLLVDKGDFAGGTSQASAMMIWGGLLYLRNLDIPSVFGFSKSRDAMIKDLHPRVSARSFRYIPATKGGRNRHFVHFCLYLYWLLGLFNRNAPVSQEFFEEASLLKPPLQRCSLLYEEAFLKGSDAKFVVNWITAHVNPENAAINYCSLGGGEFNAREKLWFLDLTDTLGEYQVTARARYVVNCAGVWTDEINNRFCIETPYRHIYSKGVFLGLNRPPEHRVPLIFEMGPNGDALSLVPWGPVSLWGPTETKVESIEDGFRVMRSDVEFLLDHAERTFNGPVDKSHIVSLRCGIRPLAVKRSFNGNSCSLDLSRYHRIARASDVPWISAYGGKITGCISLANKIRAHISGEMMPARPHKVESSVKIQDIEWSTFPGLTKRVPSLEWCMENEFCCTIEDYLRRRTNISQWVPREGLGANNENLPFIKELALKISKNNGSEADKMVGEYTKGVRMRFDRVLEKA